MKVFTYHLTSTGKWGAALFVLPTPISAWYYHSTMSAFLSRTTYERALAEASGKLDVPEFSALFFTLMATASLVGLVMLLVGREVVTYSD